MQSGKLSSWIQLATGIAVLIGLGLVIWELQQVKILARAQLTSDSAAINNSIHTAMLGEKAAATLAKACVNPEELTLHEAKILDSYYFANANLLARLALHSDRDGIYPEGYWKENMFYLSPILESQYGREWLLDSVLTGWPPGFVEATLAEIDQAGPPECESRFLERIERITRANAK